MTGFCRGGWQFLRVAVCVMVLAGMASVAAAVETETVYLFTSFRGNGDGLHLALSEDGYHWTEIEGVFLEPQVGSRLMRDPHLLRSPAGVFHMVWTTGWGDKGIGYAYSRDLINWSQQRYLPVMENVPGTRNCWAPETFYDKKRDVYIITWSSDVEGRFAETASPDRMNNRTYYVTTKDFQTFSEPRVLFDPGFDHIDATIIEYEERFILTIKEGDKQRLGIWGPIYQAIAEDPLGPYELIQTPVLRARAEGPTIARVGDGYVMYVDFYGSGRYGALKTQDFKHWTDISDQVQTVQGQRHGTVLAIPRSIGRPLAARSAQLPPPPVLPGYHADPHIAVFDGRYYIYPTTDGSEGWASRAFSCMSSDDLVHWKNHGVILWLGVDVQWANRNAWAPAIATKNGKYYFYTSAAQNIGVAVADTPYGPFTDPLGKPLVPKGRWPGQAIDPMVFVDEDGSAYLYWGQGHCWVVKLNDDMISFDPEGVREITPPGYNEGTFVIKRNGIYYLMWSEYDTRDPRYSVAYGMSDSPTGPFKKAADNPILKAAGMVKGAGHHSVVQVPGEDKWFIAYHRFAIPDGSGYKRETCISPMRFNPDGTIQSVDVYEAASLMLRPTRY
ncbi:MAG: family 43 glycosylhydrolase [Planctomycetes bacterium]|nr:family 43 glycosylhydrolase [Planctomycetota bacterium]